ncbi:MAG: tetratricopeptide repeat protein [Myxococcota bacterium]
MALHDELLRARAIAAYERALERWDHPNIRFNLARALHDVGQHLRAWEQLQQALRWGMASFSPADQARLGALRDELLGSRLAVLAIRCDEPDVSLKMDGQPLFICPGQERRVVRPGEHVVAATKPGYQPAARVVTALSGSQRAASATRPGPVAIKLYRESRLSRWPKGLPWAAVGAGVALGAVGVWYTSRVNDGSGRLAEAVTPCGDAEDLGDCDLSYYEAQNPDVSPGRIRRDRNLAIAAFTAAGALTTAGLVAVFLNRSQLTRRTQRGRIEITPLVSPDHAGLGVGGSL